MLVSNDCIWKALGFMSYTPKEIDRVFECTNLERFASHHGFPPETVAAMLNDNPNINEKQLFMTLYWWKLYEPEHAMEPRWKWHPKMIRHILYGVCQKLANRTADKIVFDNSVKHIKYILKVLIVSILMEGVPNWSRWLLVFPQA